MKSCVCFCHSMHKTGKPPQRVIMVDITLDELSHRSCFIKHHACTINFKIRIQEYALC